MIKLYTIDCPSCLRLEKKLAEANIKFEVCRDKNLMMTMGMSHMPMLQIDDKFLNFKEAVQWINVKRGDKSV